MKEVLNDEETAKTTKKPFSYSVLSKGEWIDRNTDKVAGNQGSPITGFKAFGVEAYRVKTQNGWTDYGYDGDMVGDGDPIVKIEVVGNGIVAGIHVLGGEWLGSRESSPFEGTVDFGISIPIDMIWAYQKK